MLLLPREVGSAPRPVLRLDCDPIMDVCLVEA